MNLSTDKGTIHVTLHFLDADPEQVPALESSVPSDVWDAIRRKVNKNAVKPSKRHNLHVTVFGTWDEEFAIMVGIDPNVKENEQVIAHYRHQFEEEEPSLAILMILAHPELLA